MAMTKIQFIKRSDLFKEWDGKTEPTKPLIQLVYDFMYQDEVRATPSKEHKAEIVEFLHIIKED